jgi:hypothetical protein
VVLISARATKNLRKACSLENPAPKSMKNSKKHALWKNPDHGRNPGLTRTRMYAIFKYENLKTKNKPDLANFPLCINKIQLSAGLLNLVRLSV